MRIRECRTRADRSTRKKRRTHTRGATSDPSARRAAHVTVAAAARSGLHSSVLHSSARRASTPPSTSPSKAKAIDQKTAGERAAIAAGVSRWPSWVPRREDPCGRTSGPLSKMTIHQGQSREIKGDQGRSREIKGDRTFVESTRRKSLSSSRLSSCTCSHTDFLTALKVAESTGQPFPFGGIGASTKETLASAAVRCSIMPCSERKSVVLPPPRAAAPMAEPDEE